ncbi:hypothetical protein D3C75_1222630 [compost metagenome]
MHLRKNAADGIAENLAVGRGIEHTGIGVGGGDIGHGLLADPRRLLRIQPDFTQ